MLVRLGVLEFGATESSLAMEPPHDWRAPNQDQKHRGISYTKAWPGEIPEWRNFSYFFQRNFLDTSRGDIPRRPGGLDWKIPEHVVTNLSWAQLSSAIKGPLITTDEASKSAWKDLPLADDMRPISWATSDEKMLCYYLPKVLDETTPPPRHCSVVEIGLEAISKLLQSDNPSTVKKEMKRYGVEIANMDAKEWKAYKLAKTEKWGSWGRYIFGLWHAQGQEHVDPIATSDETGTTKRATACSQWYADFAPVFQSISRIFQEIDPWAYQKYREFYDHYAEKWPFMKLHKTSGRCCFLQTAILINQHVFPHRDGGDLKEGWVR